MKRVAVAICWFLSCAAAVAAAADWPTLHRDYQRSGYVAEPLNELLERKWFRSFVEEGIGARAEAIVAEGLCFVGTYSGNLYALDVTDGRTVWQYPAGGPIGHSPCYDQGRICVCTDEGFSRGGLLCLEAATGRLLWRYQAAAGIWNSPACDGRRVYVGDRAGVFHAVDADTGRPAWTFAAGAMILKPASWSPDGRRIVFGAEDMHVYCLSPEGQLLWKSAKLPGLSLRDQAPTVWTGKVVVRTNPAMGFHEALYAGRAVLRQIQQQLPLDDSDAVVVDTPNMYFLRRTDRRERAEYEGLLRFLGDNPALRTWHTLALEDGREPWITSVLFTSGLHNPPTPPTFNPQTGELYTILPTALGVYCSGVSQTGIGIGRVDAQTGYVTNLAHAHGDREPGYFAGMPMITDETSTLGLIGDFLAVTHMGAVGGVDTRTRKIRHLHGRRDTYGGLFGPGAAPGSWDGSKRLVQAGYVQNTVNEWHGPDRALAAICDGRAFWVVGGCVVCFGGPALPAAASGGAEPPAPWKWSRLPRIDGGNVTDALGQYDHDLSLRVITAEELKLYLQPPSAGEPQDDPLRQKFAARLEAAVAELLDGHPWAPLVVELGIAHEELVWWRTAETMQVVSLSLPHLPPPLRERAIDFLDALFADGVPLDRPVWDHTGRRREWYDLSPQLLESRFLRPAPASAQLGDLYALWAYAHYADRWDRVIEKLPAIGQRFRQEIDRPIGDLADADAIAELNGRFAGLVGYLRLCQRAAQTRRAEVISPPPAIPQPRTTDHGPRTDQAAALTRRLAELATARVHYERAESRLQTRVGHHARIPRYERLVPELSRLLGGLAGEAFQTNAGDLDRELPMWYQAWGERLIGGENYTNPPQLARGLFAVMADGLQAEPEQLSCYLDQPWCRADLAYIEKLTAALRAGAVPR